jgi:hypothetical protein
VVAVVVGGGGVVAVAVVVAVGVVVGVAVVVGVVVGVAVVVGVVVGVAVVVGKNEMTRDQIIALAREAGLGKTTNYERVMSWELKNIEAHGHFAALVVAAERERCAKFERELADAQEELAEAKAKITMLKGEAQYGVNLFQRAINAERELAEANARLDWLDTVECGIQHKSYGEYWHYIGKGFPKAREVIDAAMKEKNT